MSQTIEAYREAKANYMKLRNQAKKELLGRFHELGAELLAVQRELLEDFGEKVTLPAKSKPRKGGAAAGKAAAPAPAASKSAPAAAASPSPSPKVAALQKQLDKQKLKLVALQAAGKPTKTVEDRIYEVEDEIRLAGSGPGSA